MSPGAVLLMQVCVVIVYQWTATATVIGAAIAALNRMGAATYAVDAIRTPRCNVRGSALAARRILRCNPWNEGGFDPVPKPES